MEAPADIYVDLRARALAITSELLDPERASEGPVLAVLLETGYPEAVATLVALADGTTSMYFSNGGGIIGAGEHPRVAEASQRLLAVAAEHLPSFDERAGEPPLPAIGESSLVAVLETGRASALAPEDDFGEGRHPLSPVFHAAHDVIYEVRLVDDAATG